MFYDRGKEKGVEMGPIERAARRLWYVNWPGLGDKVG